MNLSHLSRVRLLYKTILRLHRGLPVELQPLGTEYVRDEFKRHKKCNETEANLFMVEWTNYAVQLSQQLGLGFKGKPADTVGKHLEVEDLDKFSENQVVQLYELMKAATKAEHDANADSEKTNEVTQPKNSNKNGKS